MEKNKKWIKIFLIFLAVMWLCTIISKSIYVSGLTRVKTETPSKKYIEHIVEVDGIVVSGGETAVNTLSGLRVEGINVSCGDEVKKGDVLFRVDLADLERLIAQKQSELAQLELQQNAAQFNAALDAQKKEIALLWTQEDYENADRETALTVERAQSALTKAENELQKHLDTSAPHTSSTDRKKAWAKYNEWKQRCYALEDEISALEKEIETLKREIEETSEEDLEEKKELLEKKEKELEEKKDELTELERNPVSQPDYSAEESEYDTWQQTKAGLEDAVWAAKQALEDAKLARESTLRQKRRDIASAQTLSNADATIDIYNIEIAALQNEISNLNDVRGSQCSITSPTDGYVADILVSTGQRTADTAAMLITDTTAECIFQFSITKEEGKYIRLGDSIELTLNSTGSNEIDVTADYVTENNTGGYDITCRMGAVKAPIGTYGMAKRTVQGELYSCAIPIDALYSENEVYYIYTFNEKTGILGSEYYVEKLKVNVTDKNDRYAAIEGTAIGADTQVIVFSSKELSQGESIRLDE